MAVNRVKLRHSLRTKIVLVSILVEITMLALLLANSLRLLDRNLEEHAQARLEAASPLLNAALSARLLERDHASIMEILKSLVHSQHGDFRYIVVYDQRGVIYASAGQVETGNMPDIDRDVGASLSDLVYDTGNPLALGNERIGEVRYGLSLAHFAASRESIFTQGLAIASAEVILSFILLGIAGLLLTRHIRSLVSATQRVAAGDYTSRIPVTGRDEIALLAANFNTMSEATRERIEALHHSEKELFEEKERAEVTLNSIGDGVITINASERVQYMNPAAEKLTGWKADEARDHPVTDVYRVLDEQTRVPFVSSVLEVLAQNAVVPEHQRRLLVSRDEREYSIEETITPILDRDGSTLGTVLVFHNVSATRESARKLEYQASHDALTGLINRREFERRVEEALQEARATNNTHAMYFMDLDQFKVVNDTCGHNAGDELLRQLAMLLKARVRDSDVLGRLGGDEFGVLVHRCPMERAEKTAAMLCDVVQGFRFVWENKSFDLGVSIGVVPIRADTGSVAELFGAADIACYVAKDKGRNQIHIHQVDDLEHARRRGEMQWSTRISEALNENRFVLYYQKIVPLAIQEGRHPECELLVRMLDDDGNIIAPGRFLPAAERYRQMVHIDKWVIRNALTTLAGPNNGTCRGMFSINLSGQSLGHTGFADYVKEQISASGIDARRVDFEITETAAIANLSQAERFMREMKEIGCSFSLDDFGSGLSSFAYLKALPVDFLKIDGVFVRNILDNSTDRAMVAAINQMGHAIGIRTIAEFIENEAVLHTLRDIGIDYAQGYHLHMPQALPTPANQVKRMGG
jgi:diguanylate cyclase (GGDEF)-like protein/PAS domain S-box-containing protein